jgi:hypothetical protein
MALGVVLRFGRRFCSLVHRMSQSHTTRPNLKGCIAAERSGASKYTHGWTSPAEELDEWAYGACVRGGRGKVAGNGDNFAVMDDASEASLDAVEHSKIPVVAISLLFLPLNFQLVANRIVTDFGAASLAFAAGRAGLHGSRDSMSQL